MLNGLSLFTGIGGLDVALSGYIKPVAYCEIDPYCQAVLLSRMVTGNLLHAPIWDDIKTLRIPRTQVDIHVVYGGFPCQDISIAGKGKGLDGERSGLFFEIVRMCREIEPKFIFLENVPAITARGGARVVREIAKMGYDCRWCTISAASIGALHKRERWFLLAHSKSKECTRLPSREEKTQPSTRINSEYATIEDWQKAVSEMGKLSNGVSNYMDRLRALGNAVVPAQAKEAFEILMGIK